MKKSIYWIPFSIYSLVLMRLLLSPSYELSSFLVEQDDKLLHSIAFAVLIFLYLLAITHFFCKSELKPQLLLVGFFILSMTGGILEILQKFVPGRKTSISDFWFNNLGLATGLLLFLALKHLLKLFKKH
ncbi:MAG: VanZ family protein [Thermaurantimonas sp.]|uniref:VanZ family protein n=1 Tax=Thermaurantimonas sp. TaxID=2681568 RepID=UPI00391CC66F